jgi:hypothetical protein
LGGRHRTEGRGSSVARPSVFRMKFLATPPSPQTGELRVHDLFWWSWTGPHGDAECGFVLGEAVADPAPAAAFFALSA